MHAWDWFLMLFLPAATLYKEFLTQESLWKYHSLQQILCLVLDEMDQFSLIRPKKSFFQKWLDFLTWPFSELTFFWPLSHRGQMCDTEFFTGSPISDSELYNPFSVVAELNFSDNCTSFLSIYFGLILVVSALCHAFPLNCNLLCS